MLKSLGDTKPSFVDVKNLTALKQAEAAGQTLQVGLFRFSLNVLDGMKTDLNSLRS